MLTIIIILAVQCVIDSDETSTDALFLYAEQMLQCPGSDRFAWGLNFDILKCVLQKGYVTQHKPSSICKRKLFYYNLSIISTCQNYIL